VVGGIPRTGDEGGLMDHLDAGAHGTEARYVVRLEVAGNDDTHEISREGGR
jgi:hypothetical protein